jgi:GT2 family glycosyltransferase
MDKLISIIIVTYNSEEHIYNCLKSIFKYNDIKDALEVIVVDNCSLNSDKMFNNIIHFIFTIILYLRYLYPYL